MEPYAKSDDDLLEACKRGDRNAQEELYDRYAPRMYGICRSYAQDDLEAQDFLQEGFIKVFKKIGLCEGGQPLEKWVRKVIVNNNLDLYRHKYQKRKIWAIPSDEELTPASELDQNEGLRRLEHDDLLSSLRQLPEGYRQVLDLYLIEGYSHKEIAEQLEISVSTSKSQYLRAKKHIKQQFGEKRLRSFLEGS